MLAWLQENWLTVASLAAVVLIAAAALLVLLRDRRKGKNACTGKCSSCPYGASCTGNAAKK